MMRIQHPRALLVIAFILLLLGFVLPVLMVMRILTSTFFLNFFSYAASVAGLFLGIIGAANLAIRARKRNRE